MGAWGQVNIQRSLDAGLSFRSLAQTTADPLEWWAALPDERTASPRAGLAPERETELLAAWHRR